MPDPSADIQALRAAERTAEALSLIVQWRANRLAWLYRRDIEIDHRPRTADARQWEVLIDRWYGGRPGQLPDRAMLADPKVKIIRLTPAIADAVIARDSGETCPKVFAVAP